MDKQYQTMADITDRQVGRNAQLTGYANGAEVAPPSPGSITSQINTQCKLIEDLSRELFSLEEQLEPVRYHGPTQAAQPEKGGVAPRPVMCDLGERVEACNNIISTLIDRVAHLRQSLQGML